MEAKSKPKKQKKATVTFAELVSATKRKPYVPTKSGLKQGDKGPQVKRLQSYLSKFGYIESPVLESFGMPKELAAVADVQSSTFDENTAKALRRFQEFNHLPVTGELDEATLALMQRPRCGFPDTKTSVAFVASGSAWANTNLTFAYSEFTPELTQAEVRTAISDAFALWSAVTPLVFSEVALNANPDIIIRFVSGNHGDGAANAFDGVGGTLAHASPTPRRWFFHW